MISVIIPTYNRATLIKRSIDSVLNQTYKDFELIIVDDCSTDNTEEVVKSFNDARIKYFKLEKNSGVAVARNFGVSVSKGEYIAFQDSDDEFLPEKLESQIPYLENDNYDIVFHKFRRFAGNNPPYEHPSTINESRLMTEEELIFESLASTQTLLCKRKVFDELKFDPSLRLLDDYDFMIRACQNFTVFYLDKILVNVYEQNDSITKQRDYKRGVYINTLFYNKYPDLTKKYPKWELKLLKQIAHCSVMVKDKNAIHTLKLIYKKEKTFNNFSKIILYRLGLLRKIFIKQGRH